MATNRDDLKRAVHSIMNDVVEQCFHFMVHNPEHSDPVNRIIRDASDEINYQYLKIDAHSYGNESSELAAHYNQISKDLHKKSIQLLGELQRLQRKESI